MAIDTRRDIDDEWAGWSKLYGRHEQPEQPRKSYFDYDVTDYTGDNYPVTPKRVSKPVGAGAYVVITLCALIVITWLCNLVAGFIA